MRLYLAGAYSRREELAEYAQMLAHAGHEVTSRWLDGTHDLPANCSDEQRAALMAEWALIDWQDICSAEMLVCFTGLDNRKRGGRHVEYGLALNNCNAVAIVGERENVFHYLPYVKQFDTFLMFYDWLNEETEND